MTRPDLSQIVAPGSVSDEEPCMHAPADVLTPAQAAAKARAIAVNMLIREAAEPGRLRSLLHELVITREAVRVIRSQRRCLPRHAQAALDSIPYHRPTAVEFPQD